ncbi:hypothetical protein [Epilithonimonas arachidiradicis]|nr:hypothetical protein [Epilithonimonas arachidiradicis]GGG51334.1 hypothetical protein GCM10007332_11280 [Epilithonimonas arachidiradicis]
MENNDFRLSKNENKKVRDTTIKYEEQDIKEAVFVAFPTLSCSNEKYKYVGYVAARNKSNYSREVYTKIVDKNTNSIYASPVFTIPANENLSSTTQPILNFQTLNSNNMELQVMSVKIGGINQTDYNFPTISTSINNCTYIFTTDGKAPCEGMSVKECLDQYFQPGWQF